MSSFLKAASRSFTGRLSGAFSALIATYSVTAILSVSDSGLFLLSLGFALFFSHILRFGLDNLVLKKCSIYLSETRHSSFISIVAISTAACIIGSISIYGFLYISRSIVAYEYMHLLLSAFPAAVAIALLGIIAHSLHACGYVLIGTFTNTSLHFIIFTVLVWINKSTDAVETLSYFTTACFAALCLQILITLLVYIHRGIKFSEKKCLDCPTTDYREIYSTALPLWIVVIAQQLNQWVAQFISSAHVTEDKIALLALAMRLSLLVPMILTAVNMVVSPKFAALYHRGDMVETEAVLAKSIGLLASVSVLMFLMMTLLGENVLYLFGEQYIEAYDLLFILVCGQLINAMTGPSGKLLMMSGFEKDVRNTSILVTTIGVVTAFLLTTMYGVTGAALATALTISIQNIAFAFLVKRRMQINLIRVYSNMFNRLISFSAAKFT